MFKLLGAKLSTHSLAALIVFLATAYATVPQFRLFVSELQAHVPTIVSSGVSAAVALGLLYWQTHKNGSATGSPGAP